MKYFIPLLLLLCTCITARSQAYNQYCDSALTEYRNKEYKRSAELYEKAFSLHVQRHGIDFYNAACSWALAGNKEMAFRDLDSAIASGYGDAEGFGSDEDLSSLKTDQEWPLLMGRYEAYRAALRAKIEEGKPTYYWGMYLGILFVFFFYNLFLFFSLKDVTFLYYSLSIFFLSQLDTRLFKGFGSFSKEIFVWLNYFPESGRLTYFIACFMVIFHLLFVGKFLDLKEQAPKMNRINTILVWSFALIALLELLHGITNPGFYVCLLVAYIFPFITGIVSWKNGFKPAKFLVIASIFLTVGIINVLLNSLHFFSANLSFSVFRSDTLGSIAFYGLLSFALGDKINVLKQEKLTAQEKALEVLELKVQERTSEVVKQKEIIEEKNKDIIASINYAKRIQTSLLPTDKYIVKTIDRLKKK